MATIKGYIVVTLRFTQEGDQWSAVCEELGTAACGDTFEEADEAICELVVLHLNTLEKAGTREAFFKKHGIKYHKGRPKRSRPRQVSIDRGEYASYMEVPLPAAATC